MLLCSLVVGDQPLEHFDVRPYIRPRCTLQSAPLEERRGGECADGGIEERFLSMVRCSSTPWFRSRCSGNNRRLEWERGTEDSPRKSRKQRKQKTGEVVIYHLLPPSGRWMRGYAHGQGLRTRAAYTACSCLGPWQLHSYYIYRTMVKLWRYGLLSTTLLKAIHQHFHTCSCSFACMLAASPSLAYVECSRPLTPLLAAGHSEAVVEI